MGRDRVVLRLLEAGASPAVGDVRGRFPYFLAKDKDTRDAFRRFVRFDFCIVFYP